MAFHRTGTLGIALDNCHCKYCKVPCRHDKLIIGLRTAYAEELNLKKDQTSYGDLLDGLRLALKGYNIE